MALAKNATSGATLHPDRPAHGRSCSRRRRAAHVPPPPAWCCAGAFAGDHDSMSNLKTFARAGHWPTLFASFLYFDFCFAIWVLNGAMAPFISESSQLTPAQAGFLV